ncbi:sodium-coupled monocarboxylate transporter 1 [Folsomia candida]|uniref:sodium-coupled monocarboxylate transporter 1 n=1 Tax=Folsomia candida TaxID=158441 RepID=UPI001604D677|nr:sodium-coupled monocarboxylate transporter 1 [Folsomia candida]XP_035707985.1 sodium-coupled monocarboxylate transporter 1 [Folsomia candida]XP_035707986.1 sodium-coupled monocarboxylate transporter 1 [Folsomia candida]
MGDPTNVGDDSSKHFGTVDYLVFTLMLAISAGIGVFYGCFSKRQKTTKDFLMGGRNMGTIPVTLSLLASFFSAIALLSVPAEIYLNGTVYVMIGPSYFAALGVSAYLYLPVFYNLQLTSAYEYLELRFSKPVRILASVVFAIQMILYMSVVIYAPALALSQVTGLHLYGCVTTLFGIVIFYTALGGIKSVMWTDVVQIIVMFGAMIVVLVKGGIDLGGFGNIWKVAVDSGHIEYFDFDPDPRTRQTTWTLWIGAFFMWLAIYGVNQAQVQRYLTLPTIRQAKTAIWLNAFGLLGLLTLNCMTGLVIFAKYSKCDPLLSKRIRTTDQLLPIFVMDTLGDFNGFPGLFVAGIFSGALSTVSSGLNSLASITLEDYVKYFYPNINDRRATNISKISAIIYGLLSFGLVFIAEKLGGIFDVSFSIFGMIGGPLLGVFNLGMFVPWCNSKGAFWGTFTSLVVMLWLGIGTSLANSGKPSVSKLTLSVEGCSNFTTAPSNFLNQTAKSDEISEFYKISYYWYTLIGCCVNMLVGTVVSFLTGKQDPRDLNPQLISPPCDQFVKKFVPLHIQQKIYWDLGAHINGDIYKNQMHNGNHELGEINGKS